MTKYEESALKGLLDDLEKKDYKSYCVLIKKLEEADYIKRQRDSAINAIKALNETLQVFQSVAKNK
tara:strand:- start:628 stop:825 length:198 start_codon:yes stop_codon:yes gene_type:complete